MSAESTGRHVIYLGNIAQIEHDLEISYQNLTAIIQALPKTKRNKSIIDAFNRHNYFVDMFHESLVSPYIG